MTAVIILDDTCMNAKHRNCKTTHSLLCQLPIPHIYGQSDIGVSTQGRLEWPPPFRQGVLCQVDLIVVYISDHVKLQKPIAIRRIYPIVVLGRNIVRFRDCTKVFNGFNADFHGAKSYSNPWQDFAVFAQKIA